MARLYHKPYIKGGRGRRGGFRKASPDPILPADFPSGLTLPSTSDPSLLGTVTDPYNSVMTVRKISTNGGDFHTVSSDYIGVQYSKRPVESGRYIVVQPWTFRMLDRDNGYAYLAQFASTGHYASRRYPGRFYGEYNSQAEFGYDDTYYNGGSYVTVFDTSTTYDTAEFGYGEGSLDHNETYVALICRRSSDAVYEIKCVRISDSTVMGTWDTGTTSNSNINNCTMSPSGAYVVVQLTGTVDSRTAGLHVFNTAMTHQRQIAIGDSGAHIDYGWLEDGTTEVAAWVSSDDRSVAYYKLSDGAGTTVIASGSSPFGYNEHVSMKAFERPGYLVLSTFDASWADLTRPAVNAICAVRLSTGEIEIWGCSQHSESNVDNYNHQAIAVPSWDGKRIYFNSAWRSTTGTTNALMYVIERTG